VANKKLIPKPPDTDRRDPHKHFSDVASKVFSIPKSEIDEREKQWRKSKSKPEPSSR